MNESTWHVGKLSVCYYDWHWHWHWHCGLSVPQQHLLLRGLGRTWGRVCTAPGLAQGQGFLTVVNIPAVPTPTEGLHRGPLRAL